MFARFTAAPVSFKGAGAAGIRGARVAAPVLGASLRVLVRRPGWFLVVLGLVVLAWGGGLHWPAVVAAVVVLGPAAGAGLWAGVDPVSYELRVTAPARRRAWCRQLAEVWPVLSEKAGVGRRVMGKRTRYVDGKRETERVETWQGAGYSVELGDTHATVTVAVPVGSTSADVVKLADPVAAAMHAVSATAERLSSTTVALRLCMVDVLGVSRLSPEPRNFGPILLGRYSDGRELTWDPAAGEHVGMQGTAGSGKSTTGYTMVAPLAARPDVVVCGCDPSGLLLGPWKDGRGAGFIALGTKDMSQHADALDGLVAEMDQRIDLLNSRGVDKLDSFSAELPLLLVALEELPGLMAAAAAEDTALNRKGTDRVAPRIERARGRLIKEGRKAGVRVLIVAQRMSSDAVSTDDRSNLALRITHRVDNSDAVRMMHDGVSLSVDELRQWPAGQALIESPGRPLEVCRFDFTSYGEYRRRVAYGLRLTAGLANAWRAPVRVVVAPAEEATETAASSPEPQRKTTGAKGPRRVKRAAEEPSETPDAA